MTATTVEENSTVPQTLPVQNLAAKLPMTIITDSNRSDGFLGEDVPETVQDDETEKVSSEVPAERNVDPFLTQFSDITEANEFTPYLKKALEE